MFHPSSAAAVPVYAIDKLIPEARRLAAEYRRATGKPLGGVGAEIAQYDAARLLDLEIVQPPVAGYDAVGRAGRAGKRIQIKGRAIIDERKSGQRVGQLRVEQDWDSVVLVLMDENYEACEIYEAQREDILDAVSDSASSRRSSRGALSVSRFKIIGQLVWSRETGLLDDGVWDNRTGPQADGALD